MKSILFKDTTREEREEIVRKALWGSCGAEAAGGSKRSISHTSTA